MQYAAAAATKLTSGPFAGQTVDEIGSTDNGLRYLDNLRAKLHPRSALLPVLEAYLDEPVIARDLEQLLDARERRELASA